MRDAGSVQVAGELVDVRLKLGKGCERRRRKKPTFLKRAQIEKNALMFIVLVSISAENNLKQLHIPT